MKDTRDFEELAFVAKKNTVVLGSETQKWWLNGPKLFNVAPALVHIASQRFEYLQSNGLIDLEQVGPGLLGPNDTFSHGAEGLFPVRAPRPSCPNLPGSS